MDRPPGPGTRLPRPAELTAERFVSHPDSTQRLLPDRRPGTSSADGVSSTSADATTSSRSPASASSPARSKRRCSRSGDRTVRWSSHQRRDAPVGSGGSATASRCGLPSNYPAAASTTTACAACAAPSSRSDPAAGLFPDDRTTAAIFDESARATRRDYDCLMLCQRRQGQHLRALPAGRHGACASHAFTLDNGFISDGAKDNIRRVTDSSA